MKKFIALFLALGFLFSLSIFGSVGSARAAETIKMGALLDMTGAVAFLGPLFKNGITFALEEVNYTVGGKKIELIIEDTANDMNVTVEHAKKLVEMDKVHIIIGPLMGDTHNAVSPYLAGKKVVSTVLHSGTIELVKYKSWLIYPSTLEGLTLPLGYYAADRGHKTMVTVGADYAGSHGFIQGIKLGFESKGGTVIQQLWPPVGVLDYGPYLSNLKKADCIGYFGESPSVDQRFVAQYREFGVKTPVYVAVADGCLPEQVLGELGNASLGFKGQVTYVTDRKDSINEKWVKDMTKRFGQVPGGMESNAYTLTKAVLAGLKATGGDDSFDKLWPACLKVKMNTPQGPLEFSPEGVAVINGYIAEVKNKGSRYFWDPIKTYEKVTDTRLESQKAKKK